MATIFQPQGPGLTPTGVRGGFWDALARSGFGEVISESINRGLTEGTRRRERGEDIKREEERFQAGRKDTQAANAVQLLTQLYAGDPTVKQAIDKAVLANPEVAEQFKTFGVDFAAGAMPTRTQPTLQETATQTGIQATRSGMKIAESQEARAGRGEKRDLAKDVLTTLQGGLMVTGADGTERVATPREITMLHKSGGELPKGYKGARFSGDMEKKVNDLARGFESTGVDAATAKADAQKMLFTNPMLLQGLEIRQGEQGILQSQALVRLYDAQAAMVGKDKLKGDADGDGEVDRKESDIRQAAEQYGKTLDTFFKGLGGDITSFTDDGLQTQEIIALIDPTDQVGVSWLNQNGVPLPTSPNDPDAARAAVAAVLAAHGEDPTDPDATINFKTAAGENVNMTIDQLTSYVTNARQQIGLSKAQFQTGDAGAGVAPPPGWDEGRVGPSMGQLLGFPQGAGVSQTGDVTSAPGMDPTTQALIIQLQQWRDEDAAAVEGMIP